MNAKLRKLVKITAAGLFLIALAINVKVTLNDPFTMVSEDAVAETTTLAGGYVKVNSIVKTITQTTRREFNPATDSLGYVVTTTTTTTCIGTGVLACKQSVSNSTAWA